MRSQNGILIELMKIALMPKEQTLIEESMELGMHPLM